MTEGCTCCPRFRCDTRVVDAPEVEVPPSSARDLSPEVLLLSFESGLPVMTHWDGSPPTHHTHIHPWVVSLGLRLHCWLTGHRGTGLSGRENSRSHWQLEKCPHYSKAHLTYGQRSPFRCRHRPPQKPSSPSMDGVSGHELSKGCPDRGTQPDGGHSFGSHPPGVSSFYPLLGFVILLAWRHHAFPCCLMAVFSRA